MRYVQTFYVTGSLSFPLDMLRYDACFPASQDAVGELIAALGTHRERPKPFWRVELARYVRTKTEMPTVDRWASFMYEVEAKSIRTRSL